VSGTRTFSGSVLQAILASACAGALAWAQSPASMIGREVAVPRHLQDGEEYQLSIPQLIAFGEKLFTAKWTIQEGAGRPQSKGTGAPFSDPSDPLVFPRNFNRVSGPDSNSCSGCHNEPFVGGGGDRITSVFVLGQRFDFATFDHADSRLTKGALDERGQFATFQDIANERKTIGMNGSGFIEMLARQMTSDLQTIRDSLAAGAQRHLITKGVSFGVLKRDMDGAWDSSDVQGLPAPSLVSSDSNHPPSLIIMPFHQAGAVISLRQFTNNAFNHHHGIQSEERFGLDVDADGDGFANELTRADVTAVTVFQATLPVPGRVIANDPEVEKAVRLGERRFFEIGCAHCHIPRLPLTNNGWIYSEPNPSNPPGNLRVGDAPTLLVDLTSNDLPGPRLKPDAHGIVWVPAFTDLKLHDISAGPTDPNVEPLDQNQPPGSAAFFAGNAKCLTRKLWGTANPGPFMHHGKFTTMREAVLAHSGEALASRQAFEALSAYERDCIIEFLKTLQVLPLGAKSLTVDEIGKSRTWEGSLELIWLSPMSN
jgi:di-heme oxidoreductase (putative peroxidase)